MSGNNVNQSALDMLKAQYEMNEASLKNTEKALKDRLKNDGSKLYTPEQLEARLVPLRDMLNDTLQQYINEGGNPDDLTKKKKNTRKNTKVKKSEPMENIVTEKVAVKKETISTYIPKKRDFNTTTAFDIIPLPSKGRPYRHKMEKLQVAYLTANDENMFVSPNLYRDNLLIDCLLNEKILDAGIDPAELLDGDRDAIVLWLRATGYGNEFPISATDKETGTEFSAVVDLSKIEFRDFNLEADENGWFTFVLPMSKDEVKFKFLNHREIEELKNLDASETPTSVKKKLGMITQELRDFIDKDEDLTKVQKTKLLEACRNIEDWEEGIDEEGVLYTNTLTNRLEMQVMAINGNTNRSYISEYIRSMVVRDSLALRKYINENEPGLDFNVEIEKPESLGGGSQTVFLPIDQFVFLNIA